MRSQCTEVMINKYRVLGGGLLISYIGDSPFRTLRETRPAGGTENRLPSAINILSALSSLFILLCSHTFTTGKRILWRWIVYTIYRIPHIPYTMCTIYNVGIVDVTRHCNTIHHSSRWNDKWPRGPIYIRLKYSASRVYTWRRKDDDADADD